MEQRKRRARASYLEEPIDQEWANRTLMKGFTDRFIEENDLTAGEIRRLREPVGEEQGRAGGRADAAPGSDKFFTESRAAGKSAGPRLFSAEKGWGAKAEDAGAGQRQKTAAAQALWPRRAEEGGGAEGPVWGLQKAAGGEKARAAQGEKRIYSRPQGGGRPAFEMLPFGRVEDMPGPPRLFAGPDGQAGAPQPARLDGWGGKKAARSTQPPAGAFDGGGQPEAEKPLFYDYDDMHRANMAEAGKLAGEALADSWGRIHGDGEHGLPPAYDQDAVRSHIIDQAAGPTVEPIVEKALNYLGELAQRIQAVYEKMPDQPNISATEMDFRIKPQPPDRLPTQPNISATEMDFCLCVIKK